MKKYKNFWQSALAMLAIIAFAPTSFAFLKMIEDETPPSRNQHESIVIEIAPKMVDCESVAKQKCLIMRYENDPIWEYLYEEIEEFTFQSGYEYKLLVTMDFNSNPMADGSYIQWKLEKIISKKERNAKEWSKEWDNHIINPSDMNSFFDVMNGGIVGNNNKHKEDDRFKIQNECYSKKQNPVCIQERDLEITLMGGKCEADILNKKVLYDGTCKSEGKSDIMLQNTQKEFLQNSDYIFPDLNPSTLEGKSAAELKKRNIINGRPDGTFDGTASVNRAEAAKFLLLGQNISVEDNLKNNGVFTDVLEGEWYVKYIMKAEKLSIIKGYTDGTFKPGNAVNTAEFLKMLTKTFSLSHNISHNFTDVNSSDWFSPYAGVAKKYNLFPKRSNAKLEPSKELTRNEVAVAIYQYLNEKNKIEYEESVKTK